ncbi:unnamed protein product, partial [Polarella glacialis]
DTVNDGTWRLWRHQGLRVAVLRASEELRIEDQFAAADASAPHVICVELSCLRGRGGACAALRAFKGGLLVLEGGCDDSEASGLLQALGVSARFRRAASSQDAPFPGALLVPDELPPVLVGEVIGDLRLKDLKTNPELAALAEAIDPLYREHFHESLEEDLEGWSGSLLGVLASRPSAAPKGAADGSNSEGQRELLGFIVYKFWGPPLRAMSILRVAVPGRYRMQGFGRQIVRWAIEKARQRPRHETARCTLCAMPEAIRFYERLQFTPIPIEDLQPLPAENAEERGARMPGALWMELKCGRTYKPSVRR